jgi:hypothetical protein
VEAVVVFKALWAIAVVSALALGISIFGSVVNGENMRAQSAKVNAIAHRESVDRQQIAMLRAEVRAERQGGAPSGSP